MKRYVGVLLLTLLSTACETSASPATEREVRAVMQQLETKDAASVYADDFIHVTIDGTVQKKAQRLAALPAGDRRFSPSSAHELHFADYGSTAVVTTREAFVSTVNFKTVTRNTIHTRVFVKRKGRWQLVLSQLTPG